MFKKPQSLLLQELQESKVEVIDAEDTDQAYDHIKTETFSDTCRICLNEGDIPIFGKSNICKNIIEFGRILVIEHDNLPQHICSPCHELLEHAVYFRTIAMESDHLLRQVKENEGDISDTGEISDTKSAIEDSDAMSVGESSDISRVYLEYDNSECERDSLLSDQDAASSIEDEEAVVDPKDMYMIIVANNKTNKDDTFKCEACNITFTSADEINTHFLTHESETCKKCEICNNIIEINLYEIHIKLHREAFRQKKDRSKVQCKQCGKQFTKTYIKFHMKMHGTHKDKSERLKHCTICDKALSSYYFNDHMKRIHSKQGPSQEVMKKCPLCDRSFRESFYKTHVASHGSHPKKYICEQCGREFRQASTFQTHTLTHGADLKYKCQFCPYRGLHLGLLKVHVRTHTKDYSYKCTTCNKTFLTKSNLSAHERRHKPPDTFICQSCNKGFYTQRNLDKHYNMIHLGIRNVKCEICGKAFGHRDGLIAHQRKVHNKQGMGYKGRLPNYLKVQENLPKTKEVDDIKEPLAQID